MDFDNRKVYGDTSITDGLVQMKTMGFVRENHQKAVGVLSQFFMEKRVHWEVHDEIEGNSWQISTTVNGKMSLVIQILMHPSFTHKGG